jgi:hypothetical protein
MSFPRNAGERGKAAASERTMPLKAMLAVRAEIFGAPTRWRKLSVAAALSR